MLNSKCLCSGFEENKDGKRSYEFHHMSLGVRVFVVHAWIDDEFGKIMVVNYFVEVPTCIFLPKSRWHVVILPCLLSILCSIETYT